MAKASTGEDLIEHVAVRGVAASEKLLELAAAGDEDARAAVLKLIADGIQSRRQSSLEAKRRAFWERLQSTVRALRADGPVHESAVTDLLNEAPSLGACEVVQALIVEAYLYQHRGRFGEADTVLAAAWEAAGMCLPCRAGLYRRQADLRGAQGRYAEGLADADSAVHCYRELDGPGHDVDGEGKAKSLSIRGMLRLEMGDLHGSIADFGHVLRILSPRRTPDLYAYGVANLAFPLRDSGREGREEAVRLIAGARQKFHGVLKGDLPRAKLDWLEGGLKLSLGHRYRYRWKNLLRRAMEDFARMGMGAETMAVMADLARVHFKDREEIRALFVVPELNLVVLDSRFREPLRQLTEAAKERTFRAYERLDQSISRLRRVAEETPGVLPCFVS